MFDHKRNSKTKNIEYFEQNNLNFLCLRRGEGEGEGKIFNIYNDTEAHVSFIIRECENNIYISLISKSRTIAFIA